MSMWKFSLLLLMLPALSQALERPGRRGGVDSLMNSAHTKETRKLGLEEARRQLNETMALMERLAVQLASASLSETAEVWESGKRDFGFKGGVVNSCKSSAEKMLKAMALEKEGGKDEKARGLREGSREALRPMHRDTHEDFLTELRSWLTVSEGVLRRTREEEAKALIASQAPPTPAPLSPTAKVKSKAKAPAAPAVSMEKK